MPEEDLPLNKDGETELWGSIKGWSNVLGTPETAIRERTESLEGDWHLDGNGQRRIFYAESYIREQLKDILEMPKVKQGGYFSWKGETYGHKSYWSKQLEKRLNMERGVISILLKMYGTGVTAMTHGGTIRKESFHSENEVMNIIDGIPETGNEKIVIDGDKTYCHINLNPYEDYSKRFEFEYEEIAIACAPSGKIRIYYLAEAVKRVLGYDPIISEENQQRREKERVENSEVLKLMPKIRPSHEAMRKSYLANSSRSNDSVEDLHALIEAIRRWYPISKDWLSFQQGHLAEIGFRTWIDVAKEFGYQGNPREDIAVRILMAEQIYGADDPHVKQQKADVHELSKNIYDSLGETANEWISIIRQRFITSREWMDAFDVELDENTAAAIDKLAMRLGYSLYRLRHPELRILVGFHMYGNEDAYLNESKEKYPHIAVYQRIGRGSAIRAIARAQAKTNQGEGDSAAIVI